MFPLLLLPACICACSCVCRYVRAAVTVVAARVMGRWRKRISTAGRQPEHLTAFPPADRPTDRWASASASASLLAAPRRNPSFRHDVPLKSGNRLASPSRRHGPRRLPSCVPLAEECPRNRLKIGRFGSLIVCVALSWGLGQPSSLGSSLLPRADLCSATKVASGTPQVNTRQHITERLLVDNFFPSAFSPSFVSQVKTLLTQVGVLNDVRAGWRRREVVWTRRAAVKSPSPSTAAVTGTIASKEMP